MGKYGNSSGPKRPSGNTGSVKGTKTFGQSPKRPPSGPLSPNATHGTPSPGSPHSQGAGAHGGGNPY